VRKIAYLIVAGPQCMDMAEYIVDRANGQGRIEARRAFLEKSNGYVAYP
jgi:hypothetical protein